MPTGACVWTAVALAALAATECSVMSVPRGGPDLPVAPRGAWMDERGVAVDLAALRGTSVVFTAFFTSCTLRCPRTIEKLREVDEAFRRSGGAVPIVLVTLDPRTDTPDRLRRFREARRLPPNWRLLRGEEADTRRLARALGVAAAYDDGHIDHDVAISVFDATGRLARTFVDWSFDPNAAVVR
jgi:cytochrome oxidase Cu insertion factor (SCO1/SenC/PrrC family)